ncbi:MAG: putative LPS assembly protein LptD [Mucilaginibacter sp.]
MLTAIGKSNVNSYRFIANSILQIDTTQKIKPPKDSKTSAILPIKTAAINDSKKPGDTTKTAINESDGKLISKTANVIRYSDDRNIIYLIGKAHINYTAFEMDADYIQIDQKANIILASGNIVRTFKPTKDKKSNKLVVTGNDTTKKLIDTTKKGKSDLIDDLTARSADTIRYSADHSILYLINKARIDYNGMQLDADYIEINSKTHIIFARGSIDPKTKRYVGRPILKQGTDEPITADSLRNNYETKKAKAWNSSTKQQENYLTHGEDKKINEDEIAIRNKVFTTCDKPDPDFGIIITKGIVEKKRIISGPAYLEIEGVPIPIGIPFGFFPKMDTRTSGLILPTFGEDQRLGFYLRNFGYYLGLSDYADLTTMGTYYSNGSYEVNTNLNYRNRYKYSGNLTLSYGSHNNKLQGDPADKDFNITWSHTKNPNANPGSTFSASVNAGTSTFFQNDASTVGYNLQALTQNNLRSSISYGRVWAGTPFALTVSLGHSQDLTRKTVTLDLPTFNFSMATISPFDSKTRVTTEQKWYQKITVGYTLTGTNKINNVPEAELFTATTLTKKMQNGLQHQIPIGLNLNVFKYFQFNANVNYTDRWYFQTIRKRYGRADSLITDTVPGFQRVGDYSASAGFSTKVYNMLTFKNGKIKAIRHVMTPSISFSYRPDYSSFDYSFNRSIVSNATVPYPVVSQRYSIFDQGIFGGPAGGRQAGLGFVLDNNVEAKVRAKSTDTSAVERKIQLLQSLTFSTFYNFAADSFKLQPIAISGHTSIFNNKVDISFGGVLNPYSMRVQDTIQNGQVIRYARMLNRYSFLDGHFPLLQSFSISASTSLNSTSFKPKAPLQPIGNGLRNMNPEQAQKLALLNSDPAAYIDFNIPWNLTLSYNFSYTNNVVNTATTNTLMISGDVNLTKKWKVIFNSNVDLKVRQISSATSFAIARDLHCWDLSVQWLPFGYYKSYNVTLRVKSDILQDLKLSKRSDYTGGGQFSR